MSKRYLGIASVALILGLSAFLPVGIAPVLRNCTVNDYTVSSASSTPVTTCHRGPGTFNLIITGQWSYGPDVAECGWVHAGGVWYPNQFDFMINGGPVNPLFDPDHKYDCGPRDDAYHQYHVTYTIWDDAYLTLQVRDSFYDDNAGDVDVLIS